MPVHPVLGEALAALDNAAVRWVILRGEADLADSVPEVDILVDPRLLAQAVGALQAAGWALVPRRGFGTHRFVIRYLPAERRWLTLDIVTQLAFGRRFELRAASADALLRRRVRDRGLWLLDPGDRFPALALHHLLDRPAVSAVERRRLREAADEWRRGHGRAAGPLDRWLVDRCPGGIVRLAAAVDETGEWRRLRHEVRRAAVRRAPFAVAAELVGGYLRRRASRHAIPPRPGLEVALLGPDGSGKSTLAGRLAASSPVPVRRVYLGLYPVRASRGGRMGPTVDMLERLVPRGSGVARLVRVSRGLLRGAVHAASGGVTLYDRHPLEAEISGEGGGTMRRLARRWPAPDLVVLLDAPASVLYGRKPEHPVGVVEAQRRGYLALAHRRGDVRVVDGTVSLDEAEAVVTQIVWEAFQARTLAAAKPSCACNAGPGSSQPVDTRHW